jgi:hypothetical protein
MKPWALSRRIRHGPLRDDEGARPCPKASLVAATPDEYRFSRWRAEFINPETERAFQKSIQPTFNQQLKLALGVWIVLFLLFAVPDFEALCATPAFFYLLTYRLCIIVALLIVILRIHPDTDYFAVSYAVAAIIVAGFSGFMLFFVYLPEAVNWTVGVIMIMINRWPKRIP